MTRVSVVAARDELIRAALRVLSAERDSPHAHHADEAQHADEQLALAARDLTRVTEAQPADRQPVGWHSADALAAPELVHQVLRFLTYRSLRLTPVEAAEQIGETAETGERFEAATRRLLADLNESPDNTKVPGAATPGTGSTHPNGGTAS